MFGDLLRLLRKKSFLFVVCLYYLVIIVHLGVIISCVMDISLWNSKTV